MGPDPIYSGVGSVLPDICTAMAISPLPPKADMCGAARDVCFGPIADSCTAAILSLFDHQVGAAKQRKRYRLGRDARPVGALATDQFPLDERDARPPSASTPAQCSPGEPPQITMTS
jgi:hypothetical protein